MNSQWTVKLKDGDKYKIVISDGEKTAELSINTFLSIYDKFHNSSWERGVHNGTYIINNIDSKGNEVSFDLREGEKPAGYFVVLNMLIYLINPFTYKHPGIVVKTIADSKKFKCKDGERNVIIAYNDEEKIIFSIADFLEGYDSVYCGEVFKYTGNIGENKIYTLDGTIIDHDKLYIVLTENKTQLKVKFDVEEFINKYSFYREILKIKDKKQADLPQKIEGVFENEIMDSNKVVDYRLKVIAGIIYIQILNKDGILATSCYGAKDFLRYRYKDQNLCFEDSDIFVISHENGEKYLQVLGNDGHMKYDAGLNYRMPGYINHLNELHKTNMKKTAEPKTERFIKRFELTADNQYIDCFDKNDKLVYKLSVKNYTNFLKKGITLSDIDLSDEKNSYKIVMYKNGIYALRIENANQ